MDGNLTMLNELFVLLRQMLGSGGLVGSSATARDGRMDPINIPCVEEYYCSSIRSRTSVQG